MKYGWVRVASLSLLVGCAAPMEVSSITEIRPSEPGTGLDVYAARRTRGEQVPAFAGDQILEVRSYEEKPDQARAEMAGANCVVKASNFTANVTTPTKVRVPLYHGQSSTLSVSCEKQGYKSRMVEAVPFDATRSARYAGAAGGGLIGVAVVAAFDAASDNTKNDWRYQPVQVVLESETKTAAN